ncbi:hypothetical protein GF389_02800, partial [Candidatus Dojkabacteria bacterium]|nr:hypothetical protein [Candidatus Dojkabacteria bacterium]
MKKIEIKELRKVLEKVLLNEKVDSQKVRAIVEDYIEAELEGKLSHGLRAFPSLMKRVDRAQGAKIGVLKETDSLLYLDADQEFGQVVGEYVRGKLVEKVNNNGFAIALVKNMQPFLRPGFQAKRLADEGLIGVVTNSTKNLVTPFGGFEPILGTNPLGFAIPFRRGVIVADFATSKKANGEVKMAKLKNEKLPERIFFNSNGEYTTDPDAVYSIDVFGDYKGLA